MQIINRYMKTLPITSNIRSGFTLVELMVVIAIMAILATIGFSIFSGVQQNARDAKRREDIIAISNALEVNKVTGSTTYPAILSSWFGGNVVPVEAVGYTPQYTLVFPNVAGITGLSLNAGPVWAATSANIGTNQFTTVPAAQALNASTVAAGVPTAAQLANFNIFQLCARLESGTVFCRPSGQ